ncbi:MAG TPA: WGxxGxxG family protein [Pyrinomonadaceae bacterium]|nr:WGxxGxxG family protein [Pyrinomonadaceae bacterium]
MRNYDTLKIVRDGVLGLSLALSALAGTAYAQTNNNAVIREGANNAASDNRNDNRVVRTEKDEDRDWGWLGLLGLAGLLGLMPRKRVPVVVNETRERPVNDRDVRR